MAEPIFSNLTDGFTYFEGGPPVVIDPDATVVDPDLAPGASYGNTTLWVTAETGVTFGASGTFTITAGTEVRIGGLQVGTISTGAGSAVISFNASATAADVNGVLQQLTFATGAAPPPGTTLTVSFTTMTGGFESASRLVGVAITRANDPPVLSGVAAAAGYLAGSPPIPLSPDPVVTDIDSPTLARATVRIADGVEGDVLSVDTGTTGIGSSYDAATRTLTLSGPQTLAKYQEVLATVGYSSSSLDPAGGGSHPSRTIAWQLDDGAGANNLSAVATTAVQFTAPAVVPYLDLDQSRAGTGSTARFGELGIPVGFVDLDDLVLSAGTPIVSATVALTNAKAGDLLDAPPGPLTKTIDTSVPGQITLTLSGPASAATYQAALHEVVFGNPNDDPDATVRNIAVTVSNGNSSNTATARLTVNLADDAASAVEDTVLFVPAANGLLANDSDPDGALVFPDEGGRQTTSEGGTIVLHDDGSYHYVARPGFSGIDTFDYTAEDPLHNQMTARLTINVAPAADQPRLSMADASLTGLTPLGGEQTLSPTLDNESLFGLVTALAGGGYVVWSIASDGGSFQDDTAQVYDADGALVREFLITAPGQSSRIVDLQPLPNGGFVAARHDEALDATRAQAFDATGAAVGTAIFIPEPGRSLTVLSDGDFVIQTIGPLESHARIFDGSGQQVGNTIVLSTTPGERVGRVAADHDGGFIATFLTDDGAGMQGVIARRYGADGQAQGADIVVKAPYAAERPSGPVTASLPDGTFMVVWGEPVPGSGTLHGIYHGQVIGPDNVPRGGELVIGENISVPVFGSFWLPRVTALADGFVVTWEAPGEFQSLQTGVSHLHFPQLGYFFRQALTAKVFDADGQARSDDIVVQLNEGVTEFGVAGRSHSIVALADGGFAIAATNYLHDQNAFDGIVQTFDDHGNRLGSEIFVSASQLDIQGLPQIAALADGGLVAAWDNGFSDDRVLQSRRFGLDTVATIQEDSSANPIPLAVEFNDPDGSETVHHLAIAGVPAGGSIAGPPGTTATFDAGTGIWTIAGALATAIGLTFTPPAMFDGDVKLLATLFVEDGIGGPQAASAPLSIPIHVADVPILGTPGDDSFILRPFTSNISAGLGTDTITFDFALTEATVRYIGNTIVIDGPSTHTITSGMEVFVFTDGTVNNADGDRLVDDLFYYSRYHDVWDAHVEADAHYAAFGWHESRDASAFLSTLIYLSANPDVRAAGVEPLDHFDSIGWQEKRIASLTFDPARYLAANPDVAAAQVDPLRHYLTFGYQEGRQPFAPTELLAGNGFDFVYYLAHNPDVAAAHVDPLQHFQTFGWHEGRNPNALFDVNGYRANYPDVAAAGVNPLDHYNLFGWHEGRDPSVGFDTSSYLAAYPDVAAAGVNPLVHFLQYGSHEGRSPFADGVWG